MPKINSVEIENKSTFKTDRGLEYIRLDNINSELKENTKFLEFIKSGGVLLSKLKTDIGNLDDIKIIEFKKLLNESMEFKNACVWKNGVAKKLYLDRINSKKLNEKEFEIYQCFVYAKSMLINTAKEICGEKSILRIEDIVYPSETIGRELHLDRHDKSRAYQNYRSIKFFLNLSTSSCRIWGIGPSRPQLIDRLNNFCSANSLDIPNYDQFSKKGYKLPTWIYSLCKEKLLNHPISILNSVLNNIFLENDDKEGNFDLVYYNPHFVIIGDSKQVAHKPVYGTLGISIDVVYKEEDIPCGTNNLDIKHSDFLQDLNTKNEPKHEKLSTKSNNKKLFKRAIEIVLPNHNFIRIFKKKIKRFIQKFN